MITKGVILAGGNGTRLQPLTLLTNKHLLPVFDKQMIMYPLQTLLDGGVTDIMIVTGGEHLGGFMNLLGSGAKYGCNFTYRIQDQAGGIAHALMLAEDFIDGDFVVILGDNIFEDKLVFDRPSLFLKEVEDASRFGVFNHETNTIVEKPSGVDKGWAVTGCYVFPQAVFDFISTLEPSERGELEITSVNNHFLEDMTLNYLEGFWSDAGTFESLLHSANWVQTK